MRPETAAFLAKAHKDLRNAEKSVAIEASDLAARCAYYAAFHAAEALICELTGNVPKTHRGVHSEFARLVRQRHGQGQPLHAFLAQAYKHKQDADYGPVESDEISIHESMRAVPMAFDFVASVEALLSADETS